MDPIQTKPDRWKIIKLTAVLITKSQAKYWAFFCAAGVLKVWVLLTAIPSSSARALKRAMVASKRRLHCGWAPDPTKGGSSLM
jgi:hypothetical protein